MMDSQAFWGSVLCFCLIVLVGCAAEVQTRIRDHVARDTAEARRIEASAKRPEVPQDIQEPERTIYVEREDMEFLDGILKAEPEYLPWVHKVPKKLELDF